VQAADFGEFDVVATDLIGDEFIIEGLSHEAPYKFFEGGSDLFLFTPEVAAMMAAEVFVAVKGGNGEVFFAEDMHIISQHLVLIVEPEFGKSLEKEFSDNRVADDRSLEVIVFGQ
jgi:hypothetical protein